MKIKAGQVWLIARSHTTEGPILVYVTQGKRDHYYNIRIEPSHDANGERIAWGPTADDYFFEVRCKFLGWDKESLVCKKDDCQGLMCPNRCSSWEHLVPTLFDHLWQCSNCKETLRMIDRDDYIPQNG